MGRVVVTVVAPGARVNMLVPEETTVEALLPVALDLCRADRSVTWTLAPKGGQPLPALGTLAGCGVLHGSILLLERAGGPPPEPERQPQPQPAPKVVAEAAARPEPPPPLPPSPMVRAPVAAPPAPRPRPRVVPLPRRRAPARAPEVGRLPVAELRVVSGPSAGRRVPLEPGEHRAGSHRYSRIVLGDRALARVHLVIQVDPAGGVTVASAPGAVCLLDGEPLASPARLLPGQLLAAGRSLLAFGRPGQPDPLPPAWLGMSGADAPRIDVPPVPLARTGGVALGGAAAGTALAAGVSAVIWGTGAALVPLALAPVAGAGALAWSQRAHLEARARFRAHLTQLDRTLAAVRQARLADLAAAAPDAAEVLFRLESGPPPWRRRLGQPDWLRLRLGWADQPSGLGAVVAPRGAPALRTEAMRVAVRHGTLRGAPVSVSLTERGPLGIAGDEAAGLALARWLAVQLVALHSPEELLVTAALPAEEGFGWLDGLPSLPGAGLGGGLAVGSEAAMRLLDRLAALVAARSAGREAGPDVVAILHGDVVPPIARALSAGRRVGVHVVWVAADEERRNSCGCVVDLLPGDARPALLPRDAEPLVLGGADGLSVELARRAAAALRGTAAPAGEPRSELADLLETGALAEQHVLACWIRDRAGAGPRELRALLGADTAGRPVELDLRGAGPHLVISGGPPEAASAMLRALVTSVAVRHAPPTVELVLLGDFPGLAGLPHVRGGSRGGDEARLYAAVQRARAEGAPALVVAVDQRPLGERALTALTEAGGHVLIATRDPEALAAAPGLRVTLAAGGGMATARDPSGRTWEVRPAGTASLPRLVAALVTVGRLVGRGPSDI